MSVTEKHFYELTIVMTVDVPENVLAVVDSIKALLKKHKSKIVAEEDWGEKSLSYLINKQDKAMFYHFQLEMSPESSVTLKKALEIESKLMRWLLVTVESHAEKTEEKSK